MLIFTFKVYFLKFSYVSVVCFNLPDRFLKDSNRNRVFLRYLCSRTSFMIYLTLPLIFSYSIILEKFLNFFWLDTILCNGGRYSLTDLLTNVKHHRRLSFNNVLRTYVNKFSVASGAP